MKRPPPGGSAAADVAQVIKKPREMVRLESYFYATLPGDAAALASEFKADMAFKCHLCKKVYMNNVEFARHLSLHVESDRAAAVDLVDLCQCKYCFKVRREKNLFFYLASGLAYSADIQKRERGGLLLSFPRSSR